MTKQSSAALLILLSAFAYAEGNCVAPDSAAIAKVFEQGIALNEQFKKSVSGKDQATYQALRRQVEELNEGRVMPCVERAQRVLSVRDERELSYKLLQLVVSYENSADETISYSLGMIFGANPKVLENGLSRLGSVERRVVAARLEDGWLNAKVKFKKSVIADRERRLQKLRSSME
jgi:hypothetical protein